MTIIIDRDSICMGDDVSSHAKELVIADDMRFSGLMELILTSDYLPRIAGNDAVWCMEHKNEELLSYVTKSNRIFTRWCESDPLVMDSTNYASDNTYYFRYYNSPAKRAEYIFTEHYGELDFMHYEGYSEEYLYYNVGKEMEGQWDVVFFHTDYNDIYRYRGKSRPVFLLSHKDKKGSILLKETSCVLKYDLEKRTHQHEIPYEDIKSISAESVTYKKKFCCTVFTIALHSAQQWRETDEKLFVETQDEDLSPAMLGGPEYKEDYIIYSSVCESKDGLPCSLQIAMAALEKRVNIKTD